MEDLVAKGYTLRASEDTWSRDEISLFFGACVQFRKAGNALIGNYATVYDWLSYSVLKGSKKPTEVRRYAERVFNNRRKARTGNAVDDGDNAGDNDGDGKNDEEMEAAKDGGDEDNTGEENSSNDDEAKHDDSDWY